MVAFNQFFTTVLLAIFYASVINASAVQPVRHSTHGRRVIARGIEIETFHPESTFETFGEGIQQPPSFTGELSDDAIQFVQDHLGLSPQTIGFKSGHYAGANKFAYLRQLHSGVPFVNAVANIGWKDNKIVSFGSSFVKPSRIASPRPTVDLGTAIATAEHVLDGKHNGHVPSLEYLVRPDNTVALVHVIQIRNEVADTWYEALVDAHSGGVLSITDFVAHATYLVLPIHKQDLRGGLETLVDPEDLLASPNGWLSSGTTSTTIGNNVVAYKSSQSSVTNQTGPGEFKYEYNSSLAPSNAANVNAARVNAFYIVNTVHDFAYRYGFTEEAYNFQNDNHGKGGVGGDRVLMSVQDSSGTNNANFATPPDGQSGTCRMYIWTLTSPNRDGSLENDIIVHEFTHGITNRLTGGGTARCLQTTESRGLGEGWSDAMAEWTEHKSETILDYVLGDYVTNDPAGIRTHPYSTSKETNPYNYSNVSGLSSVHNIGEIWANTLHNVYAALVGEHGFSGDAKTNPDGTEGNVVYLHLFIDALSLQPCNPTFVTARAAWIQADQNRYGGANRCLLWAAFASRGLGPNAASFRNDFTVPSDC